MDSEGSLLCSQEPMTRSYPKQFQTSPCPSKWFCKIDLKQLFVVGFPPPKHTPILSPPIHVTYYTYLILDSITQVIFGEEYNHEAPHCAVFSSPLLTCSLWGPTDSLSTLFLNSLSLCLSHSVREEVSDLYKTTGKILVLYAMCSTVHVIPFTTHFIRRTNLLSVNCHHCMLLNKFKDQWSFVLLPPRINCV